MYLIAIEYDVTWSQREKGYTVTGNLERPGLVYNLKGEQFITEKPFDNSPYYNITKFDEFDNKLGVNTHHKFTMNHKVINMPFKLAPKDKGKLVEMVNAAWLFYKSN